MQLLIQIAVIVVCIAILLSLIPATICGIGLIYLVNNQLKAEPNFVPADPILIAKNARHLNKSAIGLILMFMFFGFIVAQILVYAFGGFALMSNEVTDGVIQLATAVIIAGFAFVSFILTIRSSKEKIMNFFEKASDMSALDDFFNGAVVNVVIDAEELAAYCKTKVIGQDAVIQELSLTVARRAKLNRKNKPLGVFMFVGATGVGKTELAKAVSDGGFNGRMVRFDMGEFGESHSTQRLVGAPPGYIGSEQGGALTQAIKVNGSGVILFDEIEKAHPDVMKMLLGLLDEGRITESSTGQTMDASKFIIILTSNASHKELGDLATKIEDKDELRRAVKDTLQKVFSPEQLGRVDEVFCFKPLDRRGVASVVVKHLNKLQGDVGVEIVEFDSELLISAVMRHEKQASYGIRELLRMVEKSVVDGMLDCKEMGFRYVKIEVNNEEIEVRGVDDDIVIAREKSSSAAQSTQMASNS